MRLSGERSRTERESALHVVALNWALQSWFTKLISAARFRRQNVKHFASDSELSETALQGRRGNAHLLTRAVVTSVVNFDNPLVLDTYNSSQQVCEGFSRNDTCGNKFSY